MTDYIFDSHTIPLSPNLIKQPATDKEETRQTEDEKHIIPPHRPVTQTIAADVRIHHENHRESPHRIDVFYPLCSHINGKGTEKSWNFWLFRQKLLFLPYERANQLDRLGQGTGGHHRRVLPLAAIPGVVLLSLSASLHHHHFLLFLGLSEEKSWEQQGELEKILARTHPTLFII